MERWELSSRNIRFYGLNWKYRRFDCSTRRILLPTSLICFRLVFSATSFLSIIHVLLRVPSITVVRNFENYSKNYLTCGDRILLVRTLTFIQHIARAKVVVFLVVFFFLLSLSYPTSSPGRNFFLFYYRRHFLSFLPEYSFQPNKHQISKTVFSPFLSEIGLFNLGLPV